MGVKALNWRNSPTRAEHGNKGLETMLMMMMMMMMRMTSSGVMAAVCTSHQLVSRNAVESIPRRMMYCW